MGGVGGVGGWNERVWGEVTAKQDSKEAATAGCRGVGGPHARPPPPRLPAQPLGQLGMNPTPLYRPPTYPHSSLECSLPLLGRCPWPACPATAATAAARRRSGRWGAG